MDALRIISLSIFCFLISVTTWAAPPTYRLILIGTSPDILFATGLNNRGDVVGAGIEVGEQSFFFNYSSGAFNPLIFEGDAYTFVAGISDSGLIVGHAFNPTAFGLPPAAFLLSTIGGAEVLPCALIYCFPNAVNNSGLIVGAEQTVSGLATAAITWSGPQHTLALLSGLRCDSCALPNVEALAVNNGGHIVGVSDYSYDTPPNMSSGNHAVEWRGGQVTDLGGLNGSNNSAANGINDQDDIVGMSTVGSNGLSHAFLYHQGKMDDYHQGKMHDLGTLGSDPESSAASINNRGEIVGWSGTELGSSRAFIYTHGQMYDLNSLIDPISPLGGVIYLNEAVAINSAGWIAVNATRTLPGEGSSPFSDVYLLIPNTTS